MLIIELFWNIKYNDEQFQTNAYLKKNEWCSKQNKQWININRKLKSTNYIW